jgi:phytoene/squalene synthetase
MGRIYALLLRRIEANDYNVFDRPIRLSNLRKFGIALKIWLSSKLKPRLRPS